MYKILKRTYTAIVLLVKPFILRRSCCRRHRGLLKPPNVSLVFFVPQLENRTILRIVLHGLGSPLWGEDQHIAHEISPALTRFLFQLRATLRSALAVCFVTVPTHLFQVLYFHDFG